MESLDRYIKRLKNSPATFWIGGSALVIALLLWFVVAGVDGVLWLVVGGGGWCCGFGVGGGVGCCGFVVGGVAGCSGLSWVAGWGARDDMGSPDWCSLCRSSDKPNVHITAGGMHYHATPSCSALKDGQALVVNPAPIETVSLGSAAVAGRKPCKTCKPPK